MGIRMNELMEHEKFEMPEMEIVNLSMEDVITASPSCSPDLCVLVSCPLNTCSSNEPCFSYIACMSDCSSNHRTMALVC